MGEPAHNLNGHQKPRLVAPLISVDEACARLPSAEEQLATDIERLQALLDFRDLAGLAREAQRLSVPEAPAPEPTTIDRVWAPMPATWLTTQPSPRQWLIRRPTKRGEPCDPRYGDGLFPLGKAGLFVADGGVGKTLALIALAVCIITGRRWLDYFVIGEEAVGKGVVLILAEEDSEEAERRLWTIVTGLGLSAAEIELVRQRLIVLPLAGQAFAFIAPSGPERRIGETAELVAVRKRLNEHAAAHGLAAVVCDPLARLVEGEVETSNDGATRAIQAFESLCATEGKPSVIVSHHASLDAVKGGDPKARGVTGIRNAARWEGVLALEGDAVMFWQSKSNYSPPMLKDHRVKLTRDDGGLLRAVTDEDEEEREGEIHAKVEAAIDRNVAKLVEAMRSRGPARDKAQAISWAHLGTKPGRLAFSESVTRGLIANMGTERNPSWCVCENPHTPRTESVSP
jgi:hypothetical protein